jgi:hypothetical protein
VNPFGYSSPVEPADMIDRASELRELIDLADGAQVGGSRGGAMKHAIGALSDRGELTVDAASSTGYRVVDPLLAYWVRAGRHSL